MRVAVDATGLTVLWAPAACACIWVVVLVYHIVQAALGPALRPRVSLHVPILHSAALPPTEGFKHFPQTREEWSEWVRFPSPPEGAAPGEATAPPITRAGASVGDEEQPS